MKMNVKALIFGLLALVFVSTLQSCGGDEDDPTPQKTDLELVKEGILGTWIFVSAEITKDGQTLKYEGGCDFTGKPDWYKVNAQDTNYTFATKASKHRNCSNETFDDYTYTVTESSGVFTVKVSDGAEFELITSPQDIESGTIRVKFKPLIQAASQNIITFQKH